MRRRFSSNLSAAIQLTGGVAAVLLGLIVIIGWQTGSPVLTQVRPGLPAMQYVNALAFLLVGLGLLTAGSGRDDIAGAAGLVAGSIGLLSLAQDALGVDPGVDLIFGVTTFLTAGAATPARMPANAALCFTLAGAGLFLRRAAGPGRMSMPTSFLGAVTAALALVAVVGHLTDLTTAYGWGLLTSMALHSAVGFLLAGSGLAARGWRDAPMVGTIRLPALVGVASLTASIAVWHGVAAHDRQRTFHLIESHAAHLRALLDESIEAQARALERLAWRIGTSPPRADEWTAEASRYVRDFDGLHALAWTDAAGRRWSVPEDGSLPAGLDQIREHRSAAIGDSSARLTGPVDLVDGAKGLAVVVPVPGDGWLTGTIGFDALVSRALKRRDLAGFDMAILHGVRQVHGSPHPGAGADPWITELDLDVRGVPLRLRLWPTPARLAQLEGRLPSVMLAGALALSAVLTSMTFFAGTSRRRERQLQAVAEQLRASEQRYRKARDAALKSDRLKSQFVANVSHELRTPMNGILGLTELLLETELTPEQREHARTVHECGETLLVLLNDILDLSKVAAGKLEIQQVAFEPRRLVQQTADLFTERARQKGVDLVPLVHHQVPDWLTGDPGRIRQVLTNLLGNAVKFTERGEIVVRVSNSVRQDGLTVLRVEVSDTGIGISPEARDQIFQPFVQADGSISRRFGGTGLGLVISKQLVHLMGGEMGMTSEPGRGSTFWFTVAATPAPAQAAQHARHDSLAGLRILVLDDSDAGRGRLVALIETWRMHATEAATAEEALDRLRAAAEEGTPFDAVLAQLRQPGSGLFDFAAAVHAAGLAARSRVILISARGEPGDARRAQALGAAAYLTQPIGGSDLFDCLATVFGRDAPGPEPADTPALVTRYTLERRQDPLKEPLLVVEDNVVNQKVLVGLLRKAGYSADVAATGHEALEALERTPYRLVLMDSQMPGLDGFATTAEIRRREGSARRTIIVCVTAHAMKGERERCLAAGMDDYIAKPVSYERLLDVLARWLPSKDDRPPAAAADAAPVERTAEAPVVDALALARVRELEAEAPGLLAEILTSFLRDTPARLARIGSAFAARKAAALERAAHGLKGSALAVGAAALGRLCEEIERRARDGDVEACAPAVRQLEPAFQAVREVFLRDYLTATALDTTPS